MTIIITDPAITSGPVGPRLTIPTHVSPNGGEATHPSIVFFDDAWNGYHYWMLVTPFPSGNEQHEDPNILVSNDGVKWEAAPGAPLPLDDLNGGANYNSDVSLATAEGKLYAFWRTVNITPAGTEETFYYRSSADGVTWSPKGMIFSSGVNPGTKYLSPSFHWNGDNWEMYVVNMTTSPNTIEHRMLETLGGWTDPQVCTGITMQSGKEPWHMEVRIVGGQYVMLVADIPLNSDVATNADLILLTSTNGIDWTSAAKPLIPRFQTNEHDRLYKSTFLPAFRNGVLGFDVWYGGIWSATNTWRLYKTFVQAREPGTIKCIQQGFKSYGGGVPANSGVNGVSVPISFPKPFSTVPIVLITIDNTVLNATAIQRTTSGFSARLENYTSTNAGGVGIQWQAIELN